MAAAGDDTRKVKRLRTWRQREALSRKRTEPIQSRLERDSSPPQFSWLRLWRICKLLNTFKLEFIESLS
jgi:hypothetical protein